MDVEAEQARQEMESAILCAHAEVHMWCVRSHALQFTHFMVQVLWPAEANPKKGRLLFYYTTPQVPELPLFFLCPAAASCIAPRRTKNRGG